MLECREIEELFYSFHSEFESIVMDLIEGKIDRRILDTMFEDFDTLQEKYSNKIKSSVSGYLPSKAVMFSIITASLDT